MPPHQQAPAGLPVPQPTGKASGLGAVIGVLAAVAVVVVIGVAALWFVLAHLGSGDSSHPVDAGHTAQPSAPTTSAPTPTPTQTAPATGSEKSGPGTVTSTRDGISYDLPAGWKFDRGMLAGFQLPSGHIQTIMHAVAINGDGYCGPPTSSSWHAESGFVTPGSISDKGSVTKTAKVWAAAAGEDDKGKQPTPTVSGQKLVKVDGGKLTATEAVATVKPFPGKCVPPSLETIVVSVPKAHHDSAIFVMLADQGNAGAVPQAKLDTIIRSLRPATQH